MFLLLSNNRRILTEVRAHAENVQALAGLEDFKKFFSDKDAECDLLVIDYYEVSPYYAKLIDYIVEKNVFIRTILILEPNLPLDRIDGNTYLEFEDYLQKLKVNSYEYNMIKQKKLLEALKNL